MQFSCWPPEGVRSLNFAVGATHPPTSKNNRILLLLKQQIVAKNLYVAVSFLAGRGAITLDQRSMDAYAREMRNSLGARCVALPLLYIHRRLQIAPPVAANVSSISIDSLCFPTYPYTHTCTERERERVRCRQTLYADRRSDIE